MEEVFVVVLKMIEKLDILVRPSFVRYLVRAAFIPFIILLEPKIAGSKLAFRELLDASSV